MFCACNKPAKTYTSLTNEIKLEYIHGTRSANSTSRKNSRVQSNTFLIDYKFVPAVFSEPQRLRLEQDRLETSLIGGYHLQVRVPAQHHLRLFGKSARCTFPAQSWLTKWSMNNRTEGRVTPRSLTLNQDEFHHSCSYLFDVSEPSVRDIFQERKNDWLVSWFLKFDSPFDVYDFELDWKFILNTIVDEKKPSSISLPKEIAFESINQDLVFIFK